MRAPLAGVSLLVLAAAATAAPVPSHGPVLSPAAQKQLQAEALTYAQVLLSISSQVSAAYVKPIPRAELLHAALLGLFETARQPPPANLRAELLRLDNDFHLVDFLIKTREQVGPCEALNHPAALLVSCRAMTRILDPYSAVVTDEDRKDQPWGDQPLGLGLELANNVGIGPLRIASVHPGSSAQKAGVRPGDAITHIDGKPAQGLTAAQADARIQPERSLMTRVGFNVDVLPGGPLDTPARPLRLTLSRPGQGTREVTLEHQMRRPESVLGVSRRDDNSWNYVVDRTSGVAHVRVTALNRGTAEELCAVLTGLVDDGVRGLILDLRWCPGGFLNEAVGVAGLFLGDGVIATIRGRSEKTDALQNTQPKRFLDLPLVVLVNGQTSGGGELIAAALQDAGRAAVAGQRSRGKASVQTALYVGLPGAALKLTSGAFLRPSGKNLHRAPNSGPRDDWGVRPSPELESRVSADLDRQLRQAWQRQTLRPGSDNKLLPLDDPTADPQRQLALQGVLVRMKKPNNNQTKR